MPFNPRTWFGKPNTTTPIDATNLNRIEKGIKDAHDGLDAKANAQAVADALATKLSGTEADTRYAPVWAASTAVVAGQKATLPIGRIGTRKANGNTRATFDATEQAAWSFPRLVFPGTGAPSGDIPGAVTGDRYVDTASGIEYDIAVS